MILRQHLAILRLAFLCAGIYFCAVGMADETGWSTDVFGIQEMQLDVDYWIERSDAVDAPLSTPAEIAEFSARAFASDPHLVDLAAYPDSLSGVEIAALIRSISKPYSAGLYYRDGGARLGDDDYARYTAGLDLVRLPESIDVRFGMIVARTAMRTWPTDDVVYKTKETIDLDRFQENGLFPADVVAVLHTSADGRWLFVQSYNYAAWVHREDVAIGSRDEIFAYRDAEPFLIVSGKHATTNFSPTTPAVSEVRVEMGTRLPLLMPEEVGHDVDGQNPYASHIVRLPTRNAKGALEIRNALIARNQDVHIGYMPFTRRNLLHQSFKFLGERYGWGHSYNARDCTGLVLEVYRSFGFVLPRNSGQQGESDIGDNIRFAADAGADDKLTALEDADIGDLLYSPGHVMLYIGRVDGEPYVIHDLSGSGWANEEGRHQAGVLNGVSVTPLTTVHASPEETYFEKLYAIKRLR